MRFYCLFESVLRMNKPIATGLLCLHLGVALLATAQVNPKTTPTPNTNSNAAPPPVSTLINVPDPAIAKPAEKIADQGNEKPAEKNSTPPEPAKPSPHVALILPLTSKTFGNVADAIKQGFMAAATAGGKESIPYRIYARDDEAAAMGSECRRAVRDGAIAIIGGVTRDGSNVLLKEAGLVPTLALNAPTATEFPDRFFYITLNLDAEAKSVAREAALTGSLKAAVMVTNTALAKRIQDSFEKEWIRLGGTIVERIVFTGDIAESGKLQKTLEKVQEKLDVDVIFMAADVKSARMARPFIPTGMAVFATSHTLDARADAVENLDLDSVRFLEMPWFVEKDHPAVMTYAKPQTPLSIDTERLYALGIDAWRLMQLILKTDKPKNIPPLDGVTGKLTLDGAQFVRTLTAVEMRDGIPELLRPNNKRSE